MDAEDLLKASEGAYTGEDGEGYEDLTKDSDVKVKGKGAELVAARPKPSSEVTSLDLKFLVRELRKKLSGAMIRKIYQYTGNDEKQMIFGLFVPKQDDQFLYSDRSKLYLTKKKDPAPQEPTSFCMFLRKHLMGKRILDIYQHGFDRIIEIKTQEHILIFELFSKGNVILCDSSYNIVMPMEIQKWKHREVKPKQPYRYPPSQLNPFNMQTGAFYKSLKASEKNIIATLATKFSLGAAYANEIIARAGIEGKKAGHSVTASEADHIQMTIMEMEKLDPRGVVYSDMVAPFRLVSRKEDPKTEASFSDALDSYFSFQKLEQKKEAVVEKAEKKVEKVQRIAKKQGNAAEKWERIMNDCKDSAERINTHFTTVDTIIDGMRKAKESGHSWKDIKEKISGEQTPEAEAIKEIREGDGIVILDLGGRDVEIDFNKSAQENAAKYFEDMKWARRKIGGAEKALEETEKKVEEARKQKEEVIEDGVKEEAVVIEDPRPKKKVKKRWYEYYRWFVSSDGLIVIAGKNAQQNENIVKKRLEKDDLVFHSDIVGAAFVIIKSEGKTIPQETIREASEFAAAHSKAWAKGLGKIGVFAAKPEQISKTPPSGQHLKKGSFMINGERIWFKDVPIKLSVGVWINKEEEWAKVIAGPLMPVRRLTQYFVTLRPGFSKATELAARIKRNLMMKARPDDRYYIEQVPLQDFQGQIPSGSSDMIEGPGDF